jgi:pSer/pThr/pTyr-binding forkhead associated (FHA) protein
MPVLIVFRDATEVARYSITKNQTLLGRDSTCDVVLDGERVSRRHARIEYAGGLFTVYCSSGTAPLYVDGLGVRYAHLKDQSVLVIDDYRVLFCEAGGVAPEKLENVPMEDLYQPRAETTQTEVLSRDMIAELHRRRDK